MTDVIARLASTLADRYRIERELGQGGMATVYLAHDVKHDRPVALKVLRPELAAILGGERFLKEIRTTANLQHPHILALHDSGEAEGLVYYVMPYVEGESLRDRLTREKQLPVDEAVRIAREVAGALDYAHRHGVVHRDIKPENILLHDGSAIVADFGIALAASRSEGSTRMTETGMSLGTPHYMAPEQAMGEREITPKADVYALGCVTYEMLTGEPPFNGPTAQAIIARVMTEEPRGLTIQRKTIPPHVESAVMTALSKLPADRFATAAEFSAALGDASAVPRTVMRTGAAPVTKARGTQWAVTAGVGALLLAAAFVAGKGSRSSDAFVTATQIIPGPDHRLAAPYASNLAVSPDGRSIVYIGVGKGSQGNQLYLRRLGDFTSTPIAGTADVFGDVAFSPDGRSVIYERRDYNVMRVPVSGGQATVVAPVSTCCTLQWTPEGTVFSTARGIELVPAGGGASRLLGQVSILPGTAVLLPGGKAMVYIDAVPARHVVFAEIGSNRRTPVPGLPDNVDDLDYADGYLLVHAGTTLYAVRFDPASGRTSGESSVLLNDVRLGASGGFVESQLAVGGPTLVYVPATGYNRLVLVDRNGRETVIPESTGTFHRPRFSPDGRKISMDITRTEGRDVWVYDLDQQTLTRVTFQPNGHDAVWTPDGRTLVYAAASSSDTALGLFSRLLDGDRVDSIIVGPTFDAPEAVLPGGDVLGYSIDPAKAHTDGWIIRRDGSGHRDVLATQFDESGYAPTPDGRWLAFVTDESGRREVYLRLLEGGPRLQVSTGGGREPRWSPDGKTLYYRTNGAADAVLMAARISLAPLRVVSRDTMFSVADYEEADPHGNFDVDPRSGRFVFVRQQMPNEMRVIANWKAMLNRR